MKNVRQKILNMHEECKNNTKCRCYCQSADVIVKKGVTVHHTREEFLCNTRNIARLIKLLSQYLKEDGHTVINCEDDADTQIVETALDFALEKNNITAFAEDRHIYTTFKVIFLEENFS